MFNILYRSNRAGTECPNLSAIQVVRPNVDTLVISNNMRSYSAFERVETPPGGDERVDVPVPASRCLPPAVRSVARKSRPLIG